MQPVVVIIMIVVRHLVVQERCDQFNIENNTIPTSNDGKSINSFWRAGAVVNSNLAYVTFSQLSEYLHENMRYN